jgi:two-component sensor histidine kinase
MIARIATGEVDDALQDDGKDPAARILLTPPPSSVVPIDGLGKCEAQAEQQELLLKEVNHRVKNSL